jgi:hypothetical protein
MKHSKTLSINATYCAFYPSVSDVTAKTAQTNPAGTLMIVATTASMVIFILSAYALRDIYRWYPRVVAQQWFIYDQLLTAFSFLGLVFGALTTSLIWSKRSSRAAVALGTICTLCGLSASIVTLIEPLAVLWESLVFYFLPLFITPLTGTLLTYLQEEEIEQYE